MNRIECQFGAMVDAVFAGSDYRDHDEIQAVCAAYFRRRNTDARRHRHERAAPRRSPGRPATRSPTATAGCLTAGS